MQTLGELIKNNPTAEFQYYREQTLYYKIGDVVFPVPLDDTGTATFNKSDKSIMFMRWLRKHMLTIASGNQY